MSAGRSVWSGVCLGGLVAFTGLASTGWAVVAEAETIEAADRTAAIAQTPQQPTGYTAIHVNATSGNDAEGDGSQLRPYQTITQALSVAQANTLILLAAGTYSAESGETFPLRLQSGVTVQGMAGPNTADVLIQGTGNYHSPSRGVQNVTLLGADNGGLANVTVSNPHAEGTGLWIESGSPIVLENAFFRNGANGIYIAGQGTPVIRGNYFSENGKTGLVIAGPSTAKVEANVFENSGAGITVAPESSPEIVNNQISGNLDGLIVHAEARPTLQGNAIARNRRNSIVDYAAWTTVPPLAQRRSATQPPPPAPPAAQRPAATGIGGIDEAVAPPTVLEPAIAAPPAPTVAAVAPTPASAETRSLPPSTAAAPDVASNLVDDPAPSTITTRPPAAIAAAPAAAETFDGVNEVTLGDRLSQEITATAIALGEVEGNRVPVVPAEAALSDLNWAPVTEAASAIAVSTTEGGAPDAAAVVDNEPEAVAETPLFSSLPSPGEAIDIPVIPPPGEAFTKPAQPEVSDPALARALPTAIETGESLPDLPAVATPPATAQPAATSATAPLAVPNLAIPRGSGGGSLPEVFTADAAALPSEGPPPPPSLAVSLGLNYKVLVAASDSATQAQVQAQVPDAFRTQLNGQPYIQAGAYSTLAEAQAMLNQLRQVGLSAQIQEVR